MVKILPEKLVKFIMGDLDDVIYKINLIYNHS